MGTVVSSSSTVCVRACVCACVCWTIQSLGYILNDLSITAPYSATLHTHTGDHYSNHIIQTHNSYTLILYVHTNCDLYLKLSDYVRSNKCSL